MDSDWLGSSSLRPSLANEINAVPKVLLICFWQPINLFIKDNSHSVKASWKIYFSSPAFASFQRYLAIEMAGLDKSKRMFIEFNQQTTRRPILGKYLPPTTI